MHNLQGDLLAACQVWIQLLSTIQCIMVGNIRFWRLPESSRLSNNPAIGACKDLNARSTKYSSKLNSPPCTASWKLYCEVQVTLALLLGRGFQLAVDRVGCRFRLSPISGNWHCRHICRWGLPTGKSICQKRMCELLLLGGISVTEFKKGPFGY